MFAFIMEDMCQRLFLFLPLHMTLVLCLFKIDGSKINLEEAILGLKNFGL